MPSKKPVPCRLRTRFGRNVSAMRVGAAITQEQMAERTGLSTRYWQSLEAGEYFPPLATLARIKSTLKCAWKTSSRGVTEHFDYGEPAWRRVPVAFLLPSGSVAVGAGELAFPSGSIAELAFPLCVGATGNGDYSERCDDDFFHVVCC